MPRKGYKKCSIDECQGNIVAKDLCDVHYRRQLHHGHLEQTRPVDWGTREKHPLYGSWTWMFRSNKRVEKSWWDFWKFVRDVGVPLSDCRLTRKDESKAYGPDNFFWRRLTYKKLGSETKKEYQRRSMQEYRRNNPEKMRDKDLRRKYGITLERYDAMFSEQRGLCAICGQPSTVTDHWTGKPRRLSVDHCHKEGHVRKLLCQQCNQGLGNFRHDARLLTQAASYIGS
jgi:hypothetical protein